jgi:hypothetical protein
MNILHEREAPSLSFGLICNYTIWFMYTEWFLNSDLFYEMNLDSREKLHSIHDKKILLIYDIAEHPIFGKGGQQAVSDRRSFRMQKGQYTFQ